jgi:hypothetical protein
MADRGALGIRLDSARIDKHKRGVHCFHHQGAVLLVLVLLSCKLATLTNCSKYQSSAEQNGSLELRKAIRNVV